MLCIQPILDLPFAGHPTGVPVTPEDETQFEPGRSGNTAGRPKGSRNRPTLALEANFEGKAEALFREANELALDGDGPALRL